MTEITSPDQATQVEAEPNTTDHMAHLPGVDPEWARQFIEYDQKFQHFHEATEFLSVTPRVVKIGILKPDAIIRLLRRQHKEYCDLEKREQPFEESISMDWEAWMRPMKTSLPVWDLEQGLKRYLQGMSPMEALQDIHADSEDGHENDSIGSGTLLIEQIMVLAIIAMVIIGALTFFNSAREARAHAAEIEASKKVGVSMSSHH